MSDPSGADRLEADVTRAIREAEDAEACGDPSAPGKFGVVSRIEEALAALYPADDVDGVVARAGAVTAAMRAGDVPRARELARAYAADPAASDELREDMADALRRLTPDVLASARAEARRAFLEAAR